MALDAEAVGAGHSRQGAFPPQAPTGDDRLHSDPPTLMKEATLQCFLFKIKIEIYHFKVSLKFTSF